MCLPCTLSHTHTLIHMRSVWLQQVQRRVAFFSSFASPRLALIIVRRKLWLIETGSDCCNNMLQHANLANKLATRTRIIARCHRFASVALSTRTYDKSTDATQHPHSLSLSHNHSHIPSHSHNSRAQHPQANAHAPSALLLLYLHNKHFGGNCQRSLKCKMCQMRKHFFSLNSRQLEAARGFSFLSQLTEKWRKMSLNWRVNKINLPFAWREKMRTHRFCKWSKQQQMSEWGRGTAGDLSPPETNRMRFMYKSRHLLAWVTRAATTTAMATATTTATATFHLCHEISLASFRNCLSWYMTESQRTEFERGV